MAFLTKSQHLESGPINVFSYTVNKEESVSYLAATQRSQFPTREQGLVIDCVDDLTLTDYTCAVGEIVGPKNIMYSTRISNNRVCLYLTSKELVAEITANYKTLKINEKDVTLRPLVYKE